MNEIQTTVEIAIHDHVLQLPKQQSLMNDRCYNDKDVNILIFIIVINGIEGWDEILGFMAAKE